MKRLKRQVARIILGICFATVALVIGIPTKEAIFSPQTPLAGKQALSSTKALSKDNAPALSQQQGSIQGSSTASHAVKSHPSSSIYAQSTGGNKSGSPNQESSDSDVASNLLASHPTVVRTTNYSVPSEMFSGNSFQFQPFPGVVYEVEPLRVSDTTDTSKSMLAKLLGADGSELGSATITKVTRNGETAYAGFFRTSAGLGYVLGHDPNGNIIVEEIDPSKFPACLSDEQSFSASSIQDSATTPSTADEFSHEHVAAPSNLDKSAAAEGDFAAAAAGNYEVKVMVVWSTQAQNRAGGAAAIEAKALAAIEDANYAYEVSKVNLRVTPVHLASLNSSETGDFTNDLVYLTAAKGQTINGINDSSGKWDFVRDLRNQYGADLVSMLNDNYKYCGLGWLGFPSSYSERYGYSVTNQYCLFNHTMTHEMGHNMGANHDPDNAGSGGGAYSYSYGHHFGSYRSIMAYPPGTRTHHISNPNVTYGGLATGLSNRDNARTFNNMAPYVAAFRGDTYRFSGYVSDNGFPVEGATINGGALGNTSSDENGYFEFPSVAEGTNYSVTARNGTAFFSPQPARGQVSGDTVVNFSRIYMNRSQVNACQGLSDG